MLDGDLLRTLQALALRTDQPCAYFKQSNVEISQTCQALSIVIYVNVLCITEQSGERSFLIWLFAGSAFLLLLS